jgi:hypothetical protein
MPWVAGAPSAPLYPAVRDLALRLLAGEVLDLVDKSGTRWRASANGLDLILSGEPSPVLQDCTAFDVAHEVIRRLLAAQDALFERAGE